jgi:hypothetical protein
MLTIQNFVSAIAMAQASTAYVWLELFNEADNRKRRSYTGGSRDTCGCAGKQAVARGSQAVAGSSQAPTMVTPPMNDAQRRPIVPPEPLTYPCDQTRVGARAVRQQQLKKRWI